LIIPFPTTICIAVVKPKPIRQQLHDARENDVFCQIKDPSVHQCSHSPLHATAIRSRKSATYSCQSVIKWYTHFHQLPPIVKASMCLKVWNRCETQLRANAHNLVEEKPYQ
jgi:hypothetical protein